MDIQRLTQAGDELQSEASRLAGWLREKNLDLPYEVEMALLGVQSAVHDWTEARKET